MTSKIKICRKKENVYLYYFSSLKYCSKRKMKNEKLYEIQVVD